MKSFIALNQLNFLLKYWEQANHVSEVFYQFYLNFNQRYALEIHKLGIPISMQFHKPLAGSEINSDGILSRSVKDYMSLRKYLENNIDFDPNVFLPRIPKEFKDGFVKQVDYLNTTHGQTRDTMYIPLFIKKWYESKKVCEISNLDKIELVDIDKENYLSYLPYNSFILSLDNPLVKGTSYDKYGAPLGLLTYYNKILVYIENEVLSFLAIPINTEDYLLKDSVISRLAEIEFLPKKSNNKKIQNVLSGYIKQSEMLNHDTLPDLPFLQINCRNGLALLIDQKPSYELKFVSTLKHLSGLTYNKGKTVSEILDSLSCYHKVNMIPFLLNGIGKLFANYIPSEEIKFYNLEGENNELNNKTVDKKDDISVEDEEKPEWYEVSPGNITYITIPKKSNRGQEVSIHTGREMPPPINVRAIIDFITIRMTQQKSEKQYG